MKLTLRNIVGLNAALWLGAGVFLTFGVGPALFSSEMASILTRQQAGAVAQCILSRYFIAQLAASLVAVAGALAARGMGWPWRKPGWALPLAVALFGIVVAGAFWLQPALRHLSENMYSPSMGLSEQSAAHRDFGRLHGLAQVGNLVVLIGVLMHGFQQIPAATRTSRMVH